MIFFLHLLIKKWTFQSVVDYRGLHKYSPPPPLHILHCYNMEMGVYVINLHSTAHNTEQCVG